MEDDIAPTSGNHEKLLSNVKRMKLQCSVYVTRDPDQPNLADAYMRGRVSGRRGRERPRKKWMASCKKWTNTSVKNRSTTKNSADRRGGGLLEDNKMHLRPNLKLAGNMVIFSELPGFSNSYIPFSHLEFNYAIKFSRFVIPSTDE